MLVATPSSTRNNGYMFLYIHLKVETSTLVAQSVTLYQLFHSYNNKNNRIDNNNSTESFIIIIIVIMIIKIIIIIIIVA